MPADEFYNPYHFVPVAKPSDQDVLRDQESVTGSGPVRHAGRLAADFRKDGVSGRYSHAHFDRAALSGRIIVKLTTKTPLVVGGEQDKDGKGKDDYTIVEPYRFNGEPAIPATSLRGMLSSIVEAVSQSAMRVFHNKKPVSYRQPMPKALSAIGRIEEVKGDRWSRYRLRPLVLPYFEFDNGTSRVLFRRNHELWLKAFSEYANVRCYVGEYLKIGGRDRCFGYQEFMENLSILDENVLPVPRHDTCFHMKISEGGPIGTDGTITWAFRPRTKGNIVVAQEPASGQILNATGMTNRKNQAAYDSFVPGFLRVLGGEDRDMSKTKAHELFIPFPKSARERSTLPIKRQALQTFAALANERSAEGSHEASLRERKPYLPFVSDAQMEQDRDDEHRVRLREGQLVYFEVEAGDDGEPVVSAISFSAIWRGLVEKAPKGDEPDAHIASLADFFRPIDKELLPFDSKRETISPAEWLFGFVSADGKPNRQNPHVAYAGRVRVSTGRLETAAGDDAKEKSFLPGEQVPKPGEGLPREDADRVNGMVRLKTLGSPKPPSPQLYFYDKGTPNKPIAKHTLHLGKHRPQGRKFYLHHNPHGEPWATKLKLGTDDEKNQARLKNAVRPIKDGATFWFHIDFDNLSEAELGLLCFALQPSETFCHKLGMGKGIGLGTVHLEPQALCLVDRGERYGTTTDLFTARRYSDIVLSSGVVPDHWPGLYQREKTEAGSAAPGKSCSDRATACAAWLRAAYPDALTALLAIGKATLPAHPVHTPLAADQWDGTEPERAELETFKWFANNAEHIRKGTHAKQQQLLRLDRGTSALPTLKRNRRPR